MSHERVNPPQMSQFMTSVSRQLAVALAAVATLSVVFTSLGSDRARACSYLPLSIDMDSEVVSQDGPVRIDFYCQGVTDCAEGVPDITVFDGEVPVEGRVELLRGSALDDVGHQTALVALFYPAKPLVLGKPYRVEASIAETLYQDQALSKAFDVAEGAPAKDPKLDSIALRLTYQDTQVGVRYCCSDGLSCFPHCWTENVEHQAVVNVEWESESKAVPGHLFRLRPETQGDAYENGWHAPGIRGHFLRPTIVFHASQLSYCVVLEMMNIQTEVVTELRTCLNSTSESNAAVGSTSPAIFDDKTGLAHCIQPPAADTGTCDTPETCPGVPDNIWTAWCAVRDQSISGKSSAAAKCPERGEPTDAGVQMDAGEHEGFETDSGADKSTDTATKPNASACTLAYSPSNSALGWLLLLPMALLFRRARFRALL